MAGATGDGRSMMVTLIATRGQGSLWVVAPTPAGIHPDHPARGYTRVHGDWTQIPIITPAARRLLWACARALDEAPHHRPTAEPSRPTPCRPAPCHLTCARLFARSTRASCCCWRASGSTPPRRRRPFPGALPPRGAGLGSGMSGRPCSGCWRRAGFARWGDRQMALFLPR
jgi:hypothetical protein